MVDETRKLTTILFIDVVGYSAAAERDQVSAAKRVAALRSRINELAGEHGGRVFNTAGDGFMLDFSLASAAVRAATALIEEATQPDGSLPRVRAGAHLGEVMIDGDDLMGHGVNVAARLVAQAEPNSLVISDAVKSQLRGEVEVSFTAMGSIHLPKMREPVVAHAYRPQGGALDWRRRAITIAKRRWRVLAATAAVLVIGLVSGGVLLRREPNYVLGSMQMVAHSRRPELSPALSPDGRFVVYAVERGESPFTDTDLYLQNVAGAEETQLTDTTDFNESVAAFSPTGDRLAYGRWRRNADEPCQIMVRVFPNGLDRQVGACEGSGPSRISWTPDGRQLVYSDTPAWVEGGDETYRIRLLDLDTGQVRALVPPPTRGMGDLVPAISADGSRVAFVRYQSPENADVFVYNIREGRLTRITENRAWSQTAWADANSLFVLNMSGRGTELFVWPANGRGRGRQLLPGLTRLARPYQAAGLIAFQSETTVANLWRYGGGGGASAVTSGNQDDGGADFSSEGTLAFVSSQSNDWIYLQEPGEQPRRLVEVTGLEIDGLRWSPDGRALVFAGLRDGRRALSIVDVTSGVIQPVEIETDEHIDNPAWSADGQSLIFASTTPEGPRIFRVALAGSATPVAISPTGWYEALETTDGLFAVNRTEPGIWRLTPDRAPQLALPAFRSQLDNAVLLTSRDWVIANDRFYTVQRNGQDRWRIVSTPINGGSTSIVANIEKPFLGSLAADPTTGDVVYRVLVDEQYDIAVMPYSRR